MWPLYNLYTFSIHNCTSMLLHTFLQCFQWHDIILHCMWADSDHVNTQYFITALSSPTPLLFLQPGKIMTFNSRLNTGIHKPHTTKLTSCTQLLNEVVCSSIIGEVPLNYLTVYKQWIANVVPIWRANMSTCADIGLKQHFLQIILQYNSV